MLLAGSSSAMAKAPQVLASIKPLQLISQAITEGVTDTQVLLPPGASPHNHSLRPSDARKLHSAEVIFWVGPAMESFLERSLPSSKKAVSVAMMNIQGISLRKSGEKTEESEHDHHDHAHHHDHGEYDPHIWLSTDNGRAIAKAMSKTLSEVDIEHAPQYQKNLAKFLANLDEADQRNKGIIEQLENQPLFVFHDAYGYLQDQYHLNVAGHFTLNPEQQPGAKHLTSLRDQLKRSGDTCIFREPQFQPAYIDSITQGLPVRVGVLDPLGDKIKVQPDGYPIFINTLVDNINQCLVSSSKSQTNTKQGS